MASVPSLDSVYEAVYMLYNDMSPRKKEIASKYLQDVQMSDYCWMLADDMLREKRDVASCHFAAQTMRAKIQHSFRELPPDAQKSVRGSLLLHIEHVNTSTHRVIVTQLCLALVNLALQMSSWENPVMDLIHRFGTVNVWQLLEILMVFPEEANLRSPHLGASRTEQVQRDLVSASGVVSAFLQLCLTTVGDNGPLRVRIMRCYTSWVTINKAVHLSECGENTVLTYAYGVLLLDGHQYLVANHMHAVAADCLCALLQCLEDNNNQPDLEEKLFTDVMALERCFHDSVTRGDRDKSFNYCRIFTEMAQSFMEKILDQSVMQTHYAIKGYDLILACVKHHDREMFEITFHLWFCISEQVYQKNNAVVTALFKPYIERLIVTLCEQCQIDPDHQGFPEEDDEFEEFRMNALELIRDVAYIVGSSDCFQQMWLIIQHPDATWYTTEAALFIMQASAKDIVTEEDDVVYNEDDFVLKVVDAIIGLPKNSHPALRRTSVQLLGELGKWLDKNFHKLDPVLNLLLHSLQQPQMAMVAAHSLKQLCVACRRHMGVHFNSLVQIARSLDTFELSHDVALSLLKGIAQIVSKLMPAQIQQAVTDLCLCQFTPLRALTEEGTTGESGSHSDPCLWLDRLSTILRNIGTTVDAMTGDDHPPPCLEVVRVVLPVLCDACDKYQTHVRICESLCRCLRFAIRSVPRQLTKLVPALAQKLVDLYKVHRFSCFLYLGSVLVDEYSNNPECVHKLLDMLSAFLPTTLAILLQPNGPTNHPDTVDDFFRLSARFLLRSPLLFLRSPSFRPILDCALLACSVDHRDAKSSVTKFFLELLRMGRVIIDLEERESLLMQIMLEHGQTLVTSLLTGIVTHPHSTSLSNVADVINEFVYFNHALWVSWLFEAIQTLPHGDYCQATRQQVIDFHAALANADKAEVIHGLLRDFVRLYL